MLSSSIGTMALTSPFSEVAVNIPCKPVHEGYKLWVLANSGYFMDWLFHAKGDQNGPIDLDEFWIKEEGFSKTQAVVLDLLTQNGIFNDNKLIVRLNNQNFNSI